jgi:hypothetical protein
MESNALTLVRILLALVTMGLALGLNALRSVSDERRKGLFQTVLATTAALSLYMHFELGPQFGRVTPSQVMNPHDFFHYYVGAKYHEELGYFDLYECAVIADWDALRARNTEWVYRDLRTYGFRAVSDAAREPERCRELFTDERWEAFRADVQHFSSRMSDSDWQLVLQDKGYNATPVWNALFAPLTRLLPLSSGAGLSFLLGLDYLYILGMVAVVWRTFGQCEALFVAAFWGLNVMGASGFVRGGISRLDWLLCLVVALCLLKRGRHAGAGVLAALAAGLRLFPALLFLGLFFKFLWALVRTRSAPRRYLRFGVAFGLTAGLLLGLTAATPAGRQDWTDFSVKIGTHNAQVAAYRVGFKSTLIDPSAGSLIKKAREFEPKRPLFWTVAVLVLLVTFVAVPRVEDHRTMALSLVAVFFLTAMTFYYYQDLVIALAMFLPDPRRPGLALGLASFFAWCAVGFVLSLMWPTGYGLSYWLSWSLLALSVIILLQTFLVFRGPPDDEPQPAAEVP